MATKQPEASALIEHGAFGTSVMIEGRTFILSYCGPMSNMADPVYLTDPAMPGHLESVNPEDSCMPYEHLYCHVRNSAGNAVMERSMLVDILYSGQYEVK